MSPKVSVIIPTYNRAHLIGKAIQSVLDQSFHDYEIIVVDDGSTDNTREVISRLSDKIRYIYQGNKERSAARNNGMRHAMGKYITFLDSDDIYLPEKLSVQVESMDRNPDSAMSYSYSIWFNEKGEYLHTWRPFLQGWIYPDMMKVRHSKIALPSVMIRREIPDSGMFFNESLNTCEDLEYWCRIARKHKVVLIKKGLVIINTDTRSSRAVFFDHFNSTLNYYSNIFKDDLSMKESVKRSIYTDLAVKYCLNSIVTEDKKIILKEIKKVKPYYGVFTKLKIITLKTFEKVRKYNGLRTLIRFCKNYLLIGLPQTIMYEDFEYGILKQLRGVQQAEMLSKYYIKDEATQNYFPARSADRVTRKEIRELLIVSGYLHRNRIAMLLKL